MIHKITVINPVEALVGPELEILIRPCLSFKTFCYVPGKFTKRRIESTKNTSRKVKGGYVFYAGLLDKVIAFCKDHNLEIEIEDQSKEEYPMYEPYLPGITFRSDQKILIDNWLDKPRGIIISPTGTGKTILGFGCLSAFDDSVTILWMCHTIDLMNQAFTEAIKLGFKSVGRNGDKYHDTDKRLTITTRQSFRRIADEESDKYDVVVVDEVHHLSTLSGEYHYILSRMLAPFRLGLTAKEKLVEGEPEFSAVGLIGPIVAELSINEAIDLDILAKPIMKMIQVPISYEVKKLRKYSDVYELGVVHRLELNQLIAITAKYHVDKKETVLIMVTQIAQGENIMEQLKIIGINGVFVRGSTKSDLREIVKDALNKKETYCVICSVVWKEGINIPSLDAVILGCGGKDPLQALGRGFRKTSKKDTLYYYDFFDQSNYYLIDHFGQRLCFYLNHGWL